jgi:hypothetical protein
MGLEEVGTAAGGAKKCPVDTFLDRGRVHRSQSAIRKDSEMRPIFLFGAVMELESLFLDCWRKS